MQKKGEFGTEFAVKRIESEINNKIKYKNMTKISNDVMGYKVVANNEVKMFNNVDDVVDYVVMMMKKHPNNAVYVNDMGIRLEKELDGKISVVLRDSDMNLIRGYVMGKIKRGMDKAVAYVLSYIEENEVEEQEDNTIVDDVDMELAIERLADDIADRADKTMGDYFVDVTRYMWDADDAIDEDRLRELLFDKVDGVADIDFAESDDAIVRIWFNRPIKKDVLVGEEQENALESAMNDGEECYDENGMENVAKNSSPCLNDVERVVKIIEDYIKGYNGYSASICVPWDVFDEDDMKMLIEDGVFEACVVDVLMGRDIKDMLVYDDGVYVSVDADMFEKVA